MTTDKTIVGYDFYFRVAGQGRNDVRYVRLYGPSEAYLNSIRPQYAKEGFAVSASTESEFRSANWKKRKAA